MIYTKAFLNNITCLSQLLWNDFEKGFPGILINVLWNQVSSGKKNNVHIPYQKLAEFHGLLVIL